MDERKRGKSCVVFLALYSSFTLYSLCHFYPPVLIFLRSFLTIYSYFCSSILLVLMAFSSSFFSSISFSCFCYSFLPQSHHILPLFLLFLKHPFLLKHNLPPPSYLPLSSLPFLPPSHSLLAPSSLLFIFFVYFLLLLLVFVFLLTYSLTFGSCL